MMSNLCFAEINLVFGGTNSTQSGSKCTQTCCWERSASGSAYAFSAAQGFVSGAAIYATFLTVVCDREAIKNHVGLTVGLGFVSSIIVASMYIIGIFCFGL